MFPKRGEPAVASLAKSTLWGAAGGLVVGVAIALVANDSEPIQWGFIGGTAVGLGYGIYYVVSAPVEEDAAFRFDRLKLAEVRVPKISARVSASGDITATVPLVAVGF